MELPRKGDSVLRTDDGRQFVVADVIEAGGEDLYHLAPDGDGETIEVEAGAFVKHHDQEHPQFEITS